MHLTRIYDLDIDLINKPDRPLCTGILSPTTAGIFTVVTAMAALVLTYMVSSITGSYATVVLFAAAGLATFMYSAPPARMKARGWAANLTVAIPRGDVIEGCWLESGGRHLVWGSLAYRWSDGPVPARRYNYKRLC